MSHAKVSRVQKNDPLIGIPAFAVVLAGPQQVTNPFCEGWLVIIGQIQEVISTFFTEPTTSSAGIESPVILINTCNIQHPRPVSDERELREFK